MEFFDSKFSSSAELLSLKVLLNPYPFYHWLRNREPVHWSEPLKTWMVTSFREVTEALRDLRLSSSRDIVSPDALDAQSRAELQPLFDLQRRWMQQSNPPDHTRIRSPWTKVFGSAAAERIESEMIEIARGIVEQRARTGEFDVIDAFRDFPAIVLARILGLPPEEMARFQPWIMEYVKFRQAPSLQTGKRAMKAIDAWREAFSETLERLSTSNGSAPMVEIARQQGVEQLFATFTSLVSGRYEPTIGLVGNGMLALLLNPDQHPQALGEDFSLHAAVDEMLRYDCPFQSAVRVARDETSIGERRIAVGEEVLILLGGANRDPARFDQPDAFMINRSDQGYLSFGHGTHYCLGVSVAQSMARAAIGALIEWLPRMRLTARHPDWQFEVIGYRAMRSLPVTIV